VVVLGYGRFLMSEKPLQVNARNYIPINLSVSLSFNLSGNLRQKHGERSVYMHRHQFQIWKPHPGH